MRLISAHIDNFGKLKDFDINFDSNPYIILEDNGWGKTTLAAFIKVMLYGFDGDRKQKISENERKMYYPWNRGIFGGSIVFEADGKEYKLNRVFGKKVLEDTVSLKDNHTNLESNDYDLERIGEQIFGIDAASFKRTIFISKNDMEGDSDGLGGSIQAKIGNLTDATDDVNNYEVVMKACKDRLLGLKSGNKKGKINEAEARAAEIKAALISAPTIDNSINEYSEKYAAEKNRIEENRLKIKELDKMMKGSAVAGEYTAKKNNYLSLRDEVEGLKQRIDESKAFFKFEVPDEHILDEMIAKARELEKFQNAMENNKPQSGEKITNLPTMEQIEEALDSWSKFKDYKNKLIADNIRLESAKRDEETKKQIHEDNLRKQFEDKRANIEKQYADKENAVGKNFTIMIVSGVAALFLAVLIYFIVGTVGGAACGAIAIGLTVGSFIYRSTALTKVKVNRDEAMLNVTPDKTEYVESGEAQSIAKEMKQYESEAGKIYSATKAFFEQYGMNFYEEGVEREIYSVRDKVNATESIKQKQDIYEKAKEGYELNRRTCEDYMLKIGAKMNSDILAGLLDVKNALGRYEQDYGTLVKKEEACEHFWDDSSYDLEHPPVITESSTDEIAKEKEILNEEIENCDKAINAYRKSLDELTQKRDALSEGEEELEDIEASLDTYRAEYGIIELVSAHLKKAKEQLTATYMDPIADAFVKYYGYIYEDDLDSYEIDANINITKIEEGANRSIDSLSAGYKDLTQVALRMALVDSMYTEEKPFIIMDDPFVNLDTNKVKAAKQFLEEVAKNYQVLYFTCHESRT